MRLVLLSVPLTLFACSGSTDGGDSGDSGAADSGSDSGADSGGDSGSDSGADSGGDSGDTGEDPGDATVTGSVLSYDGSALVGAEVQFCETVCFSGETDGNGAFSFQSMDGGSYKLDVLGHTVSSDLGWIRVHAELEPSATYSFGDTLFVPRIYGPESMASGSATFGAVTLTGSLASLDTPFGYEDDEFWGGWVDGADVPELWGVSAAGAVNLTPLGTLVSGPLGVSVDDSALADGSYDVYSVDEHGEVEGPVGTGTASGGMFTASGLTPTILSWLLLVPAQ